MHVGREWWAVYDYHDGLEGMVLSKLDHSSLGTTSLQLGVIVAPAGTPC